MKVKQTFMIGLFVTSFLTSCDQQLNNNGLS